MNVVAELTVAAEEFALGSAVGSDPTLRVELDRVVEGPGRVSRFVWTSSDDAERLEGALEGTGDVDEWAALDRVGDRVLYRADWSDELGNLGGGSSRPTPRCSRPPAPRSGRSGSGSPTTRG